ncbi:MAG: TonB-dependent receptor [Ferruginibacter sp.]
MKFTAFFILVVCLQVSARSTAQVTLSERNASLAKVFKLIEKQSGYHFWYDKALLKNARLVDIQVKNATINQVLDLCLLNEPFTYTIVDMLIAIQPKYIQPVAKKDISLPVPLPPPFEDITIVVRDSAGQPLSGASIKVKGTNKGIITDANGSAVLRNTNPNSVLEISFTGYNNMEVTVGNDKTITVRLTVLQRNLDDIVVVGYGTQKKITISGAVSSVSTKELKQSPVANLSNALAGRLPGLFSVQNSGEPGADASRILIRGIGTYSGGQNPLILVDGVERSFDGIDANEVESITILKDASSTAVYGVRGANGVLLVTTKRGTNSKPKVSVTVQSGLQSPTRLPNYLNSFETLSLYKEGLINDGLSAAVYTDEYLNKYKDRTNPTYQYLYPDVNWFDEILKPNSTMSQANMNVSGGTQAAKYFVSLSYLQQNGLYKFEDNIKDYNIQAINKRYNFRSNIDLNITKDLTMQLNLGDIIRERNYPGASANDIFNTIKLIGPNYYPFANPDGSISGLQNRDANPYGTLTQRGYQRLFENNLTATAGFNLNMPFITKGLSAKTRLSFDALNYRNVNRSRSFDSYAYSINDTATDLSKGTYTRLSTGSNILGYDVNSNGNRRTLFETSLAYDRVFGKHSIRALALYTQQSYLSDIGGGTQNAIAGLPFKYQGYVGRLEYGFQGKLFGEFDFGYNGSENFPEGQRFGFFPAISGSYVISKEDFFQNLFSAMNLLKVRASYGVVGNDNSGGGRFLYQSTWSITQPGYQFGVNYDGNGWIDRGAAEQATGNENITWERARKVNLGLDAGLWHDQLTLSIDVFTDRRSNILTSPLNIPSYIGISNLPYINAGVVSNKGFEVVLETRKQYKNYGYFFRGNYSFARNKIVDQKEPKFIGREWQQAVNRRIGEQYGYTALGLFRDEKDVQNSARQTFGAVQPGDIKYKDLNADGVIDQLDEGFLGPVGTPEAFAGLALGLTCRGFDFSILFQGAMGGSVYYTGNSIMPFSGHAGSILDEVKDNHWTVDNPNPNALFPRMSSNDNVNNYKNSTFWIRSSDYIRLKNVEAGYSFPKAWLKRIGFTDGRIFVNAINVLTWDKIKTFDPEIPNGTGNYPQQKVVNAGLNFTF